MPAGTRNDQGCPIRDCLHICNELLFHIGLELREQRRGLLSLVSFDVTSARVAPPADVDLYRPKAFLRWLIRTHVCITSLVLWGEWVTAHSEIVLEELPDNSRLKKLLVRFPSEDTSQTHIATLLPRLRFLEELILSNSPSTDDFLEAVSELLRTTTCLRSLAFDACCSGQPPKTLTDAVAANSTLKTFELWANWYAAMPPGTLGKYVMSDRLLTKLVLIGNNDDRQEFLLEECLVRNSTVSTLKIRSVCGGESTARFLTRILAECSGLNKLAIGNVRHVCINVSDATLTLCAEALAANETLQELTLPYSLWHPTNWIAFFDLLPRNTHLRSLEISQQDHVNHVRTSDVIDVLAWATSSPRVSFNVLIGGHVLELMHFRAFTTMKLSGGQSLQLRVLERLPALDHFTDLWIDVHEAGEPFFSSLANYIRDTTVLRRLTLIVTNPQDNFQYNDRLARTIGHSRSITRVTFRLNAPGNADEFVIHLSAALGENYNLFKMNFFGVNVGVEARRSLFRIRETVRRNSGLLELAAAYSDMGHLDGRTANAFEKVSRCPALVRVLAEKKGIAADEVASMIRRRLMSVDGVHDFMRLTGVVRERVTCAPPLDGCSTQLHDLNAYCWRLVRRYLSFDDVKRVVTGKPDFSTPRSNTSEG
ncbi:hypothetical protein MTO96_039030 [Rhipicephalus appendiculatus]